MRFITDEFEIPKAEKVFVDRAEPRALFWQHFDSAAKGPMESPLVLCYYGMGGIGKTALSRQLEKELKEKQPKAKSLTLDFQFVERREPYRILALLRKKLSSKHGFEFPLFELAYYCLLSQMGEEIKKPEAQSLIGSSEVLSVAMEVAGYIPGADMVAGILKKIDDGVTLFRRCFFNKKNMLNKLKATDPQKLMDELPIYFAADLRDNLVKEKAPFVMFVDTYEILVNEMAAIGDPLRNDNWLRGQNGLIQRLPGVIWVISGREKLKWEELSPPGYWDGVLHQYLLGTLSPKDTGDFLTYAGIDNREVQQRIYDTTEGLPVYLDLCVEQYMQSGAEALDVTPNDLFERCTRYMDDSEKNILFLLACMGSWTDASAYAAGKQMPFDFSPVFYEKLLSFSFVQSSDGVHYTLMRQVAKVLQENCPAAIRHACANLMMQAEALPETAQDPAVQQTEENVQLDADRYIKLLLADVKSEEDLGALLDEIQDILYGLCETLQLATLYDFLNPLWELAADQYPGSRSFARIQTFYSMALYKQSEFDEAERQGLVALDLLNHLGGEVFHLEVAVNNLGVQYGERLQFGKIPPLFEDLWFDLNKAIGPQAQICQSLANYIAVSYQVMEMHDKANEWFARYDSEAMAQYGSEYVPTEQEAEIEETEARAAAAFEEGDVQSAIALQQQAADRSHQLFGENSITTLRAMENTAAYLSAGKYHQEATDLQREVVQRYIALVGEHDSAATIARMHLCEYMLESGDEYEAYQMGEGVAADLVANFGPHYSATIPFRFTLLCDYCTKYEKEALCGGYETQAVLDKMSVLINDVAQSTTLEEELKNIILDTCDGIAGLILDYGRDGDDLEKEIAQQVQAESKPTPVSEQYSEDIIADRVIDMAAVRAAREPHASSLGKSVWLQGDAPLKKVATAIKKFGGGIAESDVLLMIDTSVMGSGKNGALFTNNTMYYKVIGAEGRVPLYDIVDLTAGKTEVLVHLRDGSKPISLITAREQATINVLNAFLKM